MASILVTGATGTTGSEVVRQLDAKGIAVRAGVHSADRAERIKGPNVELAELDYGKPDTVKKAFEGIDKLFLLTPVMENHIEIAAGLVDTAVEAGVSHIVRLSALGADSVPGITLGRWHRLLERYIIESGTAWTLLRPTAFMQNFINYFPPTEGKLFQPLGTGAVSYVDARDVAAVAVEVLTKEDHQSRSYPITGGAAITVEEVAAILSEVAGRAITYMDIPGEAARQGMIDAGQPGWMADAILELLSLYKTGAGAATTTVVEEITGRKPTSFIRFARDHARAFREL